MDKRLRRSGSKGSEGGAGGFAGLPPKGETTHYDLCVAGAPSNHVRCASTGKRVTRFSGRFAPLRIVFPCHRGIGRATKGKRLYGQARRLTSPDLHILCRMCTVDNKAPQSNPFTQRIAKNKVPPPGGRWWRQPPKGVHFLARQGGCTVFAAPGSGI